MLAMFLALSRNHLLSCAKGHVARISVSADIRYTRVREREGSPPICRHNIQLTPAKTETKHRLKAKFSSPEFVRYFEAKVEPAFPTSLPFITKLSARTSQTPLNTPHGNISNYQIHTLSRFLGDGVNIGLHSRLKGLCTAPGKPEDQKETSTCASSSSSSLPSSSPSNEVQFKELVSTKKHSVQNRFIMKRRVQNLPQITLLNRK